MATSTGSARRPVPILNYHAISDRPGPEIAAFAVRPDEFARHLDLIVAGGHSAVTVSRYVDLLDGGQVPPGTVVITFDDGFEDNLTVATPMLVARQMPATMYLVTGHLPGCPGGPAGRPLGPMISWDRLGDLEAAGLEIGAHSHSHPQLDLLRRCDASPEISRSRDLLQDALGHSVASFAYPHGYASSWLQAEVRRAGFRSACGVRDALSYPGDNPWLLARLVMRPSTTCAQLSGWLRGTGASIAPPGERLRTKAWRAARRARTMSPGRRPAAGVNAGSRS